jgi:glycosyltransferase involved in cell wall biosynthesis
MRPKLSVIIPAYNEEEAIALVIRAIPKELVTEIIVCNNGSRDNTRQNALNEGATVLDEPQSGYGNACLKGVAYLKSKPLSEQPDILVFIDGDYSDYPEQLPSLIAPILEQHTDLVIGSRVLGKREKASMTPQQVFGNWLATTLIRWIYGYHFTDLGPFRAIKWDKFLALNMIDRNYGWTVEMQIKAAKHHLTYTEIPVDYRARIGVSKVSGTIKGTILAGYKILFLIFKYI